MKEKKITVRSSDSALYSVRNEGGKNFIDFYPAVFNQRSKLIAEWGETFFEIIAPTAFSKIINDEGLNTIATIDHDRARMIGRVKSGTLILKTDEKGLKASLEIPDTTQGRDLLVMIERGDYFECSFIYTIAEGGVNYDRSEDIAVRTISDIDRLIDVSIVVDGAFANTTISTRDWTQYEQPANNEQAINSIDILKKKITILNFQQ